MQTSIVINRMLKIQFITEFENFRRNYLYIVDFLDIVENTQIIEQYTLPTEFIEMTKQIEEYKDPRDDHLHWVVHTANEVLETIEPNNEIMHDFRHFYNNLGMTEYFITRILKKPLYFRQSIC